MVLTFFQVLGRNELPPLMGIKIVRFCNGRQSFLVFTPGNHYRLGLQVRSPVCVIQLIFIVPWGASVSVNAFAGRDFDA